MKIFIGADHNGFQYKAKLSARLQTLGYDVVDAGDAELMPTDDFPLFAAKVAASVLSDTEAKGILICGSGQGMVMAANRFKGIRASLCWNVEEARASRNDDDSNVLCIASRYTVADDIDRITDVFLTTPYAGEARFARRIKQLDELN